MFAPQIPFVALFGDPKDHPRSWSSWQVAAFDDDGEPWVVANETCLDKPGGKLQGDKKLSRASTYSNYLGLQEGYGDRRHNKPIADVIPAPAGWRAAYAWVPPLEEGADDKDAADAWVLPVVAWKRRRDEDSGSDTELIPIVSTCENGRARIDVENPYEDEPSHVALYAPGEEVPSKEAIIALVKQQLKEKIA